MTNDIKLLKTIVDQEGEGAINIDLQIFMDEDGLKVFAEAENTGFSEVLPLDDLKDIGIAVFNALIRDI